jgi:hypothetical protein
MIAEKLNTKELFAALDDTARELLELVSAFDENEVNTALYKDSWTRGQLTEHLVKSFRSIAGTLNSPGKIVEREPGERAQELKATFLDFTVKFKSPESVLPTGEKHNKEMLIADLESSIDELKEARYKANLIEAITAPGLGEMTKLEFLYLALYHTQRHIQQMRSVGVLSE